METYTKDFGKIIREPELFTSLELEKVTNYILLQVKEFELKKLQAELDYDKLGKYDSDFEKIIQTYYELEIFYRNLLAKVRRNLRVI